MSDPIELVLKIETDSIAATKVIVLTLLDVNGAGGLEGALAQALPGAAVTFQTLKSPEAGQAIRAAMDAL